MGDAKEELERALALQPQDAKSQDLLAGVYYRLGVYPRAIELWAGLVEAMPKEPALRVNLALVLIKTGQGERAREHLRVALDLQPDHGRAWGYLGLIHFREGRLREAQEAFMRGGQEAMVRRVEEALAQTSPGLSLAPTELEAHDRDAMRGAAEEALQQLQGGDGALALARSLRRRRGSGAWQTVEPGDEVPQARSPAPIALPPSASLDALIGAWSADTDRVMGVVGDALHVQSRNAVHAR
ncbi:MAG: tetratricopeptide repeat protein, partial [Planctomycetota bacterium]